MHPELAIAPNPFHAFMDPQGAVAAHARLESVLAAGSRKCCPLDFRRVASRGRNGTEYVNDSGSSDAEDAVALDVEICASQAPFAPAPLAEAPSIMDSQVHLVYQDIVSGW